jgi:festuclavine dehydrogenase
MLRFDQEKGEVYAAAGDGRLPFVSVADIAAVAYRALTDERPHNTAHLILGPEQLSYQDVRNAARLLQ